MKKKLLSITAACAVLAACGNSVGENLPSKETIKHGPYVIDINDGRAVYENLDSERVYRVGKDIVNTNYIVNTTNDEPCRIVNVMENGSFYEETWDEYYLNQEEVGYLEGHFEYFRIGNNCKLIQLYDEELTW